ncbi:MAG: N-acetylmuramoyl-L-alanine amidase [Muribaculaceae bacterium]|nr:N-acetylmuramoyl-L-alanine amidase [Muribaculaceae bacterium]
MKTVKLGSKGDDVVALQKALDITADGVFGPKTETAVKSFQKGKGLVADGIVGARTWAALEIAKTANSKCVDPSVVYLPLSVHVSKLAGRSIKYLAIHYTAGSSSAPGRARAVKHVFENRQASADFAVDDAEMVQFNPDLDNYYCWAVGDKKSATSIADATNRNTISIEICSTLRKGTATVPNHEGWEFTEAALANAARLAKILMRKYNIPIERVVRHYDISGKVCPGIRGWNNAPLYTKEGKKTANKNNSEAWLNFKSRLV